LFILKKDARLTAELVIFRALKFPKIRYYNKQVRWDIKQPFDVICGTNITE